MKKLLVILTFILSVTLLFGCNQPLRNRMLEKYSNNDNYVCLSGEVIRIDDNYIEIRCEELSNYLSYEDDLCSYYIYSDNTINLFVRDLIDFVTVPFHFYNGHRLPIVELKKNGDTLLTFDEGKENLIDWVNTTFDWYFVKFL